MRELPATRSCEGTGGQRGRVLGFVVMLAPAQLVLLEAALDRLAGLDALWLFGSEASGRTTADSDVDLGALFARRPSAAGLLAARIAFDSRPRSLDGTRTSPY